jgi:ferrous iron transport protein B
MVVVINFLNSWGTDGSFGNEDSEKSTLSAISRSITPLFSPFGIEDDNWPATVGIFTGVLAKEVVVGTLDAIYSQIDQAAGAAESTAFNLGGSLTQALQTIPENLDAALNNLGDPLGLNVLETSADQQLAAKTQSVDTATFGAMNARFDGQAGAFAYLLFILLYAPCTAATAAIYREAGSRWMWFTVAWTTSLGFGAATLFYQIARFSQQPATATGWIIGISCTFMLTLLVLRTAGKYTAREVAV